MHKPAPAWPNPISITCAAPASDLLLHQAAITAASGASPLRGEIPLPALPEQGLEGSWGGGSEDLCTPRGSPRPLRCCKDLGASPGAPGKGRQKGKGRVLSGNSCRPQGALPFGWERRRGTCPKPQEKAPFSSSIHGRRGSGVCFPGFPAPQPLAGGNGVGTACKPCSHLGNNPAAFGGHNSGPGGRQRLQRSPAPTPSSLPTTSYTGAAPKPISPLPQAHRGRTAPIPSHTSILQQQGHQPLRNPQPLSGGKSSTPKTPK